MNHTDVKPDLLGDERALTDLLPGEADLGDVETELDRPRRSPATIRWPPCGFS